MRTASLAIAALALGGLAGYGIARRPADTTRVVNRTTVVHEMPVAKTECRHDAPVERTKTDDRIRELRSNPPLLRQTLDEFRRLVGTEEGDRLAILLGEIRDPAVEQLALELARAGHVAGFELLDRLNIENPETRRAIVEFVRTETRPEQLAAAIYALHRGVPDPREARETIEALRPAAGHADAEVRRRAVVALGEWGDVATVLRALQDPSVDVRAGAAFALGRSKLVAPAVVDALVATVENGREDWAVREQAWRSLGTFPLDDRAHGAWARFRELHDAAGEASQP